MFARHKRKISDCDQVKQIENIHNGPMKRHLSEKLTSKLIPNRGIHDQVKQKNIPISQTQNHIDENSTSKLAFNMYFNDQNSGEENTSLNNLQIKENGNTKLVDISNRMEEGGSMNIKQKTEEIRKKCLDIFNKGTEKEILKLNGIGKKKSNKVISKREEEGFDGWKTLDDALEFIGFSSQRCSTFLQKIVMAEMICFKGNTIQFGNKLEINEPKEAWADLDDINIE